MLLLAMFLAIGAGRYEISYAQIFDYLKAAILGERTSDEQIYAVITHIRLPRIAFAVLVGAALSASGTVYQGLFKNPHI